MHKLLPVLFLNLITLSGFAQLNYPAEAIPQNLKPRANAIVREIETTVDMRAIDQVMLSEKRVVTILNKNGDDHADLDLFYDKSTSIQRVKGQILDAWGKVISKFSLSDFTDRSAGQGDLYIDYRIKSYSPAVLTYPYTIVYEYEIRNKQNLIIPEWTANPYPDLAVEKDRYTFISKPSDEIRIKATNYNGEPEIVTTEKSKSYTWTVKNIPAIKPESYTPNPETYQIRVKIAPKQFSYYGYKGRYENWNELGRWVYNDLIRNRQELPPETVIEMEQLVKGADSDLEKAKRVYAYMQKKTRYISVQIGIGGFQPMQAAEVQQVSYGDCKALVNYTQSLLKAVNVPAVYCAVYAGNRKKSLDPGFATMDQANHVILCLPLKTDTVWLECTSQQIPFGYLGDFTDDRFVLACTPEGGKILKTPALKTEENLQVRKGEFEVSEAGDLTGKLITWYSGSQYDNIENIIHEPYPEQLKKLKKQYDIDNINFSEVTLEQDKGLHPITTEALKVDIPKYAVKSGQFVYLQANLFNKARSITETKNRSLPVYINRGYTDEDELTFKLPKGYQLEEKPERKALSCPFGSYTVDITVEGNTLRYKRKMVLKDGTYPASSYAIFSEFMNRVADFDTVRILLKTN